MLLLFILEEFFQILDKADSNNHHRACHAEEEEGHNYFRHETNDKVHRSVIVLLGTAIGASRSWRLAVVDCRSMRQVPWRLWSLAVLSGALQVLPFPIAGPVPLWRTHFCWIALLPLLYALLNSQRNGLPLDRRQGAALGYLCGFVWYLGSCYWIFQTMNVYGGLPRPIAAGILVLFCLYLGLYHALFGGLFVTVLRSRLGRQGAHVLVPVIWVATELARSRITGFPWDLLGITQVDNPLLRQLAPWTGVAGLSFLIAAVNALWLLRISIRDRPWVRPTLAATGVLIVIAYTFLLLRPRRATMLARDQGTATLLQENLMVGRVETNPPENEEQLLERFSALSRRPAPTLLSGMPESAATHPLRRQRGNTLRLPPGANSLEDAYEPADIVVWPESPAPFQEADPAFRSAMTSLAQQMSTSIVVGNIGTDQAPRTSASAPTLFNSASFVKPDGTFSGRYDKMHLVPFGEYVPFKPLFFFAGSLLGEVGTFQRGTDRSVFSDGSHTYGTFICYESIFGDEIRQFSKAGADVLINISNDGWYGDTSAPWQHLNMVRMRALENHRWILRATNTGITSVIDPSGRVVAAAPRHIRTAIRVPFSYEHDLTFYAAHGDILPWLCGLVTLAAIVQAVLPERTK